MSLFSVLFLVLPPWWTSYTYCKWAQLLGWLLRGKFQLGSGTVLGLCHNPAVSCLRPQLFCFWLDFLFGPWTWFTTCLIWDSQQPLLPAPDSASCVQTLQICALLLRALSVLDILSSWLPPHPFGSRWPRQLPNIMKMPPLSCTV